jgi:hypothetical protein
MNNAKYVAVIVLSGLFLSASVSAANEVEVARQQLKVVHSRLEALVIKIHKVKSELAEKHSDKLIYEYTNLQEELDPLLVEERSLQQIILNPLLGQNWRLQQLAKYADLKVAQQKKAAALERAIQREASEALLWEGLGKARQALGELLKDLDEMSPEQERRFNHIYQQFHQMEDACLEKLRPMLKERGCSNEQVDWMLSDRE